MRFSLLIFTSATIVMLATALFFSLEYVSASTDSACLSNLEQATHHLGDNVLADWEVSTPEGTVWTKEFPLNYFDRPALLKLETFDTDDTKIRVNGQMVLELNAAEVNKWAYNTAVLGREMLMTQDNLVRIEVGGGANRDDMMFRNVEIVTCYSTIELNPHHLGDTTVEYWRIPAPEFITMTRDFVVGEDLPKVAMIALDVFDLDGSPDTSIIINEQTVGMVTGFNRDKWQSATVLFDGSILRSGTNTLKIVPGYQGTVDRLWDDIIVKDIRFYYDTIPVSSSFLPLITSN